MEETEKRVSWLGDSRWRQLDTIIENNALSRVAPCIR
jgi:hypothetical protein